MTLCPLRTVGIRPELAERIAVYRTELYAAGFGPEEIKAILDPIISLHLKNQEEAGCWEVKVSGGISVTYEKKNQ